VSDELLCVERSANFGGLLKYARAFDGQLCTIAGVCRVPTPYI